MILSDCTSGGCGAKIEAGKLGGLLRGLHVKSDPDLIVGFDGSDDASVYELPSGERVVSSVDFFPPMVDDPELFGSIAAANALSDIFAMNAKPIYAQNIVAFPEKMDEDILRLILKGGAEKLLEADTVLSGGHSIYDSGIKYGLSVTGILEPDKRLLRNSTVLPGDKLILTKPLGTGIILAARRVALASDSMYFETVDSMKRLNKYAAECMNGFDVHACTDITGFGLLVHLSEMLAGLSAVVYAKALPRLSGALELADEYILTAGGQRNRNYIGPKVDFGGCAFALEELMLDPQTSGGLLIAVSPYDADSLLRRVKNVQHEAEIIGEIVAAQDNMIEVKNEV